MTDLETLKKQLFELENQRVELRNIIKNNDFNNHKKELIISVNNLFNKINNDTENRNKIINNNIEYISKQMTIIKKNIDKYNIHKKIQMTSNIDCRICDKIILKAKELGITKHKLSNQILEGFFIKYDNYLDKMKQYKSSASFKENTRQVISFLIDREIYNKYQNIVGIKKYNIIEFIFNEYFCGNFSIDL